MSKRAEAAALKAYPPEMIYGESTLDGKYDGNATPRYYYIKGYEQAEQDLALTWEDVNLIDSILIDMQDEGVERYGGLRQYYEEALKRFNVQRKK